MYMSHYRSCRSTVPSAKLQAPHVKIARHTQRLLLLKDVNDANRQLMIDGVRMSWLSYSTPQEIDKHWQIKNLPDVPGLQPPKMVHPAPQYEVLSNIRELPKFVTCPACDAQCYLMSYDNPEGSDIQTGDSASPLLVICVRGTTSLQDWMCNTSTSLVDFKDCMGDRLPGVKVHEGFNTQFMGLFSLIDDEVKRHLHAGGHLLCVGHSLGHSTSTLAAVNYASQFPSQVWHIGVAGPRVGNKTFANIYDATVGLKYRLRYGLDPVPALVTSMQGYCHCGTPVQLGVANNYPDVPLLLHLGDHHLIRYLKALSFKDMVDTKHTSAR